MPLDAGPIGGLSFCGNSPIWVGFGMLCEVAQDIKKLAHYQLLEPCHKLGPIRPLCLLCIFTLHNQRSSCKDGAPVLANNPS